jgi:hypothetical protein
MTRKTLTDRVCQLLAESRQNQPRMEAEARARGVSLDQLLAATIAEMVFEMLDPTTDDAESECFE